MSGREAQNNFTSWGRATSPEAKREVVERLLEAWMKVPQMRLGQLLGNVVSDGTKFFYIEDRDLIVAVVEFCETTEQ